MNNKIDLLNKVSNFKIVEKNLNKYCKSLNIPVLKLYISNKSNKKYMIYDAFNKDKWVHFGDMDYEDFTKHKDNQRRESYLKRASNMKGNWRNNPLSANNLSIHLLW
jgi:hypothetical protein